MLKKKKKPAPGPGDSTEADAAAQNPQNRRLFCKVPKRLPGRRGHASGGLQIPEERAGDAVAG